MNKKQVLVRMARCTIEKMHRSITGSKSSTLIANAQDRSSISWRRDSSVVIKLFYLPDKQAVHSFSASTVRNRRNAPDQTFYALMRDVIAQTAKSKVCGEAIAAGMDRSSIGWEDTPSDNPLIENWYPRVRILENEGEPECWGSSRMTAEEHFAPIGCVQGRPWVIE